MKNTTSNFGSLHLLYDKYDGVIIKEFPKEKEQLQKELELLIKQVDDKKLLWIKIDREDSSLIPLLTSNGFIFHHCNETDITLVKKLIINPIIPTAKNHTIGVGAIVIDNGKLLVVKDKIWQKHKLPGGHMDDREGVAEALKREVYEETGIEVEFEAITSIGHFHPGQFGESNLYIVCKAQAKSFEIDIKDTSEIIEARWLEVEVFLNDEDVHPYNKNLVRNSFENRGLQKEKLEELIKDKEISYELFH